MDYKVNIDNATFKQIMDECWDSWYQKKEASYDPNCPLEEMWDANEDAQRCTLTHFDALLTVRWMYHKYIEQQRIYEMVLKEADERQNQINKLQEEVNKERGVYNEG